MRGCQGVEEGIFWGEAKGRSRQSPVQVCVADASSVRAGRQAIRVRIANVGAAREPPTFKRLKGATRPGVRGASARGSTIADFARLQMRQACSPRSGMCERFTKFEQVASLIGLMSGSAPARCEAGVRPRGGLPARAGWSWVALPGRRRSGPYPRTAAWLRLRTARGCRLQPTRRCPYRAGSRIRSR